MNKKYNLNNIFNKNVSPAPGYAIAILNSDRLLFNRCEGLANLKTIEPITLNTAFRTASLTKQFTAMAIMILKERKLINFDYTIEQYLPIFPIYGKNITIRQLLTHISGIPDHEQALYKSIKPYQEPSIYESLAILMRQKKLLFKSGDKFQYSDSGFVLLAIIIEKLSGMSYSDFLSQNIFAPLGMNNTIVVDETKPKINNRAKGYKLNKGIWEDNDYDPLNFIVGDEGIYSTINDLIIWKNAWQEDILISYKTLSEAMKSSILNDGATGRCGFSWFIENKKRSKIIYQTGTWVGFNNIMLTDVVNKKTVIVLSNCTVFPFGKNRIKIALDIINSV